MATNRETIEFLVIMAQEYPKVGNLPYILETVMRLARRHGKLMERRCNEPDVPEDVAAKCERLIVEACKLLPGCVPVFQGDPRGATVKLKVPSGRYNDWGATGVCVPQ